MNVIKRYGDHRELHVLTHSIPTRHASDLNSLMRPLFPSAAVREQKYALISSWRAQGSPIRSRDADKPGPDSVFLIAEGETPPVPARTLVVSPEGRYQIGRASCRERVCQYV